MLDPFQHLKVKLTEVRAGDLGSINGQAEMGKHGIMYGIGGHARHDMPLRTTNRTLYHSVGTGIENTDKYKHDS